MHYARLVVGYHGCDAEVADRILRGEPFKASKNDFDWLGEGVYFWEHGAHRAFRFAQEQQRRGKVTQPVVVGALIQLGACFDLLDTRFTQDIAEAYKPLRQAWKALGREIPKNGGGTPDRKLRRLDCAVLNAYLQATEDQGGTRYQTVRGAFREGRPVFKNSCIYRETHIQIAVRDPACILGAFRPPSG